MRKPFLIGLIVMLFLVACRSDDPTLEPPRGSGNGDREMDMGDDQFAFGRPGDSEEVDRIVDMSASDSLEFAPDSLTVQVGDSITFVVTNEGKNVHEFVLGDEAYQQEHAAEMSDGEHMNKAPNQIEIEPGETETLTWTFTDAAEVIYGCHEPGHYEGGMFGTIQVSS